MSARTLAMLVLAWLALCVLGAAASGQVIYGPPEPGSVPPPAIPGGPPWDGGTGPVLTPPDVVASRDSLNPISVLGGAAELFAGRGAYNGVSEPGAVGPSDDRPGLSAAINVMILLTTLTLVPSIVLMCTCFLRILIVLGLLKQALGTQSLPPSQVLTGLALFMTLLVMSPTIDRIWSEAVEPYSAGEIRDYDELWDRAKTPVRDFMFDQIEATGNWSSLIMVLDYRGVDTSEPETLTRGDVDMISLIPAYMLSELKVAFLMGFRVYLPFLVIDMVIASLLISMSMMMLPPVLISLPFKLLLFVLVDGWTLVVGSLLASFRLEGESERLSEQVAAAVSADFGGAIARAPPWAMEQATAAIGWLS